MLAHVLRFSAYVYVADEEEGVAKLDVVRLGRGRCQGADVSIRCFLPRFFSPKGLPLWQVSQCTKNRMQFFACG